ncbi:lysophospholipase L1-like esterase [Glaciihabitans tibetensis]|uniref:Lysophospholipase L1-like esterase n=1 Tax=Glaciihabitans tibetensis TaxID=1266600 RepID=A0A2T0VHF9_9MICO|nr:GDSL-type esterase/lipase family protein [Glaciihabitans tibetensis]PRY69657.1 lysophospholipase L1-like esterase [Glaciihabitans tibetensis]
MSENPETPAAEKIVFVGDSATHGGRWQEWFPEAEVHVEAAPGDTTDQLVERLPAIIELQPDIVVLLMGSNDFGANRSVEYVVRSIEYFLAMLRRDVPGARTLVQSIMPRGREYGADIKNANRHVRQFATTLHAQYLDLWPSLGMDDGELSPEFTNDRLHLSEAGYEAWLGELRPALGRLRDAPPMTAPITIIRGQ